MKLPQKQRPGQSQTKRRRKEGEGLKNQKKMRNLSYIFKKARFREEEKTDERKGEGDTR